MQSNIHSIRTHREAYHLLLWCALAAGIAAGQVNQSQLSGAPGVPPQDNVPDAINRLVMGKAFPADIKLIAKAKGVQAIPDLKKQFDVTEDSVLKSSIASTLVTLGDNDLAPWNYLVSEAEDAITSPAPSPAMFDSKGKLLPGPSPKFIAWAKTHNLKTDSALEIHMVNLPAAVAFLGDSRDPRAIPILRQALLSSNYLIQAIAAQELAQFQDKNSIPLIIEACQQAPTDAAATIARSLVDFDDPQAQTAAKAFRPPHDEK